MRGGWLVVVGCVLVSELGGAYAAVARQRMAGPALPPPVQVAFASSYPVGSIVIVNAERALYYIQGDGQALRYPIAIGTRDEQWTGREVVTDKKENPVFYGMGEDGERPTPIPGGHRSNPLGARALYLGKTFWRIHGTIAPGSIGKAVSNGCIRMHNAHVIDLFERASIGTEVYAVRTLAEAPPQKKGRKLYG